MPREAEDLTGRRFGTREVMGRARAKRYERGPVLYWRVRCVQCGTETEVQGGSLRQGAGCAVCRHRGSIPAAAAHGSLMKHQPATAPPVVRRGSKRIVTWGQMRAKLKGIPDDAQIQVNLVCERGWSFKPVNGVTFIGSVVVLGAELPAQIHRWKERS